MIEKEAPEHLNIRQTLMRVAGWAIFIIAAALLVVFLTSCASVQTVSYHDGRKTHENARKRARITFYSGRHEKVAMNGHRAIQGVTLAAHPKYPFKTKIEIPGLFRYLGNTKYEVQDRGTAVTRRKASHGKTDVLDIFVANPKTMRRLERDCPEYMDFRTL